jgi:hypothetical protein
MGASQVPAASVSADRKWVQLSSVTPTAVSTISFTSLTAYKYYKIVSNKLSTVTSASALYLRLNNDSASNYGSVYIAASGGLGSSQGQAQIVVGTVSLSAGGGDYSGVITINSDLTKEIQFTAFGATPIVGGTGNWFDASQINRIDLILAGSFFSTTGTIKVFGSN